MLTTIDVITILASMLLVIGVGVFAGRKKSDTAHGYFLGGNKMPWWLIGTAFVATGISSEQMIGTVGAAYQHGMGIANWEWFGLPCYALVLTVFIPIYLKNKVTTVPGFLADRFGPACGTIYSCMLLAFYVCIYTVTVLYAGSLAFSEVTGWNFYFVLLLIVVGVGAYSIHGGLTSVMWADLFQCILLMAGGITLFFAALGKISGGWGALIAASPERSHLYQPPGHEMAPFMGMIIATFGAFTFYQVGNQAMIQRMLAARSTWHAPLEKPDLAFTFALGEFAPAWGVRGIVVAGLIAAVMAALSAQVNSASTLFSTDIYKKLIHKGANDHEMVRVGRIASFVVLLLAAVLSPVVGLFGIFKFFQFTRTAIAIPFMATTLPKAEIAAIRRQEATNAAGIIGAELIWLNFDDEFLIDLVQTRHAFIEAFHIARPDVVFCHWREDYNPDHSISGMIVDECIHMGAVPNIETASPPTDTLPHIYFMDTPAGVNFVPEIYVDITSTFAKKVEMVRAHASQGQWMTDIFGYDMEAFLEIPAKFRGLQASCPMAEAFRPSYRWGRTFRQHYLQRSRRRLAMSVSTADTAPAQATWLG